MPGHREFVRASRLYDVEARTVRQHPATAKRGEW